MTTDSRYWNDIAESYAAKPVANSEAFERKIAMTIERITPNDVVLDVGCGTGSLALRLAPHARQVHGLDLSSEMVRIARTKAFAAQMGNVSFHVGSFEACDLFEPGSLDAVCAYSLLHLVPNHCASLRRIFGLLKPGGYFISSTVCIADSRLPLRPVLAVMRMLGKAPRVHMLRRSQVEQDIRRAGFVDVLVPDVGAERTVAFVVATKP